MEAEKKIKILAALAALLLVAGAFQLALNLSLLSESKLKDESISRLALEKAKLEFELGESAARGEELSAKLNKTRAQLEEREAAVRLLAEALQELNSSAQGKSIEVSTLAVERGKSVGVVLPVSIQIKQGEGRLFVDMEEITLGTDYQDALKNAMRAAVRETGEELSETDVFIRISNPYDIVLEITGESAGAAISMALIALLSGRQINREVLITGAVDERGKLYPIEDVEAKARAARAANATALLVPKGQRTYVEGISIIEVGSISEATRYMLE